MLHTDVDEALQRGPCTHRKAPSTLPYSSHCCWLVLQEYQRALANANGRITPDLESAIERMNTYNAWQVDAEAKRLLDAVGLTNPNATVNALSGGQRRRLALAAALLGNPELLILDEPTNHMDVQIIDWMARELTGNADLAVVMVTHDRSFMEATCTRLLELDGFGGAYLHKFGGAGSYKAFKEVSEQLAFCFVCRLCIALSLTRPHTCVNAHVYASVYA